MKRTYLWFALLMALVVACAFMSGKALAAELLIDMPLAGPVTIERGSSPTGPFSTVATVPQGTTRFLLTPGQWGHYRARNAVGPSNTVEYRADLYAGPIIDRMDAIETRLTALETPVLPPPPAPASNFTITHIDATHIRIVCSGIGITTDGRGTERTMECRQ